MSWCPTTTTPVYRTVSEAGASMNNAHNVRIVALLEQPPCTVTAAATACNTTSSTSTRGEGATSGSGTGRVKERERGVSVSVSVRDRMWGGPHAVVVGSDEPVLCYTLTEVDAKPDPTRIVKPPMGLLQYSAPSDIPLPPDANSRDFWINLLDSRPNHIHLAADSASSLRISDGVIVVVDCLECIPFQTESLIWKALAERVKPVLVLNNVDRLIELKKEDPEEVFRTLSRSIDGVNCIISTFIDSPSTIGGDGDSWALSPEKGNVVFASSREGWAFTIGHFARLYASKFGLNPEQTTHRLWGENYYDPVARKWKTDPNGEGGKRFPRFFCQFIIEPMCRLRATLIEGDLTKRDSMLCKIGVVLRDTERSLTHQALVNCVMGKWLPFSSTILEVIAVHLPSPVVAQQYRIESLYTGPMNDAVAESMRACDPNGPLLGFVSSMVPLSHGGRFLALCRVFSGTINSGTQVRIMGPQFVPGMKYDLFIKTVQKIVLLTGRYFESIPSCPCGNVIGLIGIDSFLVKSGTISDFEEAHKIKDMKFSDTPVVKVTVEPKIPADLPRFVEGLKRLSRSDPLCQCNIEESGDHTISCASELHLEMCLHDLSELFCSAPLRVGTPITSIRETILADSKVLLTKSPNKFNRLYMNAQPLRDDLTDAIDNRTTINSKMEPRILARTLVEQFNWEQADARKVWCFGPEQTGPNLLVDGTKAVQYLNEIKDSVTSAFQWAMKEGPLCDEPVRGVRINLHDVTMTCDINRRGGGQIIPTARRCFYGCILSASPAIAEPVYLVELQCRTATLGAVYSIIMRRRGQVIWEDQRPGWETITIVRAHIPVMESFGFPSELRSCSCRTETTAHDDEGEGGGGMAIVEGSSCEIVTMVFDHWAVMTGDPHDTMTRCGAVVSRVRSHKCLPPSIPNVDTFVDKL